MQRAVCKAFDGMQACQRRVRAWVDAARVPDSEDAPGAMGLRVE